MLIFLREYMEMCFHGNQLSWVIKHPFISLCFKYHFLSFICFSYMLAPVISNLDEIYCISEEEIRLREVDAGKSCDFVKFNLKCLTVHYDQEIKEQISRFVIF